MKRLIPFTVNRVVRHAWASMAQPLVVQAGVQARVARVMCTRRSERFLSSGALRAAQRHSGTAAQRHSERRLPTWQNLAAAAKPRHERPAVRRPTRGTVF
jgi:hypothetical protein